MELIDGLCEKATIIANKLKKEGFNILNDVVFNQVLVSCNSPEKTEKTLKYLQNSGKCWCGGSKWKGESVIRISVSSWATTDDDIDKTVEAFIEARIST